MDFRNNDELTRNRAESVNEAAIVKEYQHTMGEDKIEKAMAERMVIAKSNKDLIDLCIATKSDNYLSKKELLNYGVLALNTAAMDAVELDNFRVFARRRIELTLNKAIAEAYLIDELAGKVCDNDEVCMEFDSIEKTYCYN